MSDFDCTQNGAADTNATNLAICKTCMPVAATMWENLQPNDISNFSAAITTVAREPISDLRQRRKGTVTDLKAAPEFKADTTLSMIATFMDGFLMSQWQGVAVDGIVPTAVEDDSVSMPVGPVLAEGALVAMSGFGIQANNGLHSVAAGSTATSIAIPGLLEEIPPPTARVFIAGVTPLAGDLQWDGINGLTSVQLDFTTLPLIVGSAIWIGGATAAEQFEGGLGGIARIASISSNRLALVDLNGPATADQGAGKSIPIFFGSFVSNVRTSDPRFTDVRYTMEASYNTVPPLYEYARDCRANELALDFPLAQKSTMDVKFVGRDVQAPTTERLPGLQWADQQYNTAFNTAADFIRLKVADLDGAGVTTFLGSTTITAKNNRAGENTLGMLGATFVNFGNFDLDISTEAIFTNGAVLSAVRNNQTVSLQWFLANHDGGVYFSVPSMTLGDGSKTLSVNQKIKIKTTASGYVDDALGYTMGVTLFRYLPIQSS
ncbi:hypothetical protein HDG34_005871 [Paraburkholderia sp. HC6.4b]|uniref:phage tail tube protein n=1 Tax=unclassified Paraburkholderia TaxID=2615204 RepID=UPI00160D8CAB|nr:MULTISPECIES: phage tail tube protein [unclassified Paraburkholderia]MBB5411905.1 hypothetical protein [Paraburkholderia sp. HC6.4b]MBB5450217.1 hypothetical protein [Paraburkholderia sp. Kb1A]